VASLFPDRIRWSTYFAAQGSKLLEKKLNAVTTAGRGAAGQQRTTRSKCSKAGVQDLFAIYGRIAFIFINYGQ